MAERTPYTDQELEIFRTLIDEKLTTAKAELQSLLDSMSGKDNNGTDDTRANFKPEDGDVSLEKEQQVLICQKQETFIQALKNALIRIERRTYGICVVTGEQIPKERLMAVPHATKSIAAKKAE